MSHHGLKSLKRLSWRSGAIKGNEKRLVEVEQMHESKHSAKKSVAYDPSWVEVAKTPVLAVRGDKEK